MGDPPWASESSWFVTRHLRWLNRISSLVGWDEGYLCQVAGNTVCSHVASEFPEWQSWLQTATLLTLCERVWGLGETWNYTVQHITETNNQTAADLGWDPAAEREQSSSPGSCTWDPWCWNPPTAHRHSQWTHLITDIPPTTYHNFVSFFNHDALAFTESQLVVLHCRFVEKN